MSRPFLSVSYLCSETVLVGLLRWNLVLRAIDVGLCILQPMVFPIIIMWLTTLHDQDQFLEVLLCSGQTLSDWEKKESHKGTAPLINSTQLWLCKALPQSFYRFSKNSKGSFLTKSSSIVTLNHSHDSESRAFARGIYWKQIRGPKCCWETTKPVFEATKMASTKTLCRQRKFPILSWDYDESIPKLLIWPWKPKVHHRNPKVENGEPYKESLSLSRNRVGHLARLLLPCSPRRAPVSIPNPNTDGCFLDATKDKRAPNSPPALKENPHRNPKRICGFLMR